MRARFAALLIHQAVVQRTTQSQSTSGELIDSWATVGTITCRYIHRSQRLAMPGVGFPMVEDHMLLCDTGTNIMEKDRVQTITLKATGASVEAGPLTVESVLNRNDDRQGHHMSVQLERIE